MERQLVLIDTADLEPEWQLDEETKEIGLRGVRAAREALRLARLDRHSTAA